jgi:protein MpaA
VYIGTSVQGRSIYAYYFGSGANKIVFFGAIHGSEANTRTLMNRWATELENNSDRIPSDKTIIVIPTVNPDGIANRSRFNANGVDLNRNFDTPSWVTGTYLQTDFYPTGGGSAPFSEPESQDIRDLMYREHPYLTLTYHSAAGYVIPTNSSSAISFGNIYSQLSGYRYVTPGDESSFTYDITGTFEEWAEGHGYNALVIELSSAYSDQFTQNSKAMWRMVEQ